MVKKAKKQNVLFIVDEAYFYFYPESVIDEVKNHENLIVLRTFSKLCGMATLRLGYAAASTGVIDAMRKVKPTYDANGLAVLFGKKILEQRAIIRDLIKSSNEGKKYITKKLKENGIEFAEGKANFVLIKCDSRTKEITDRLAEQKVLVLSGFRQNFLKDYIRVTIGSGETMEGFWRIFKDIWGK